MRKKQGCLHIGILIFLFLLQPLGAQMILDLDFEQMQKGPFPEWTFDKYDLKGPGNNDGLNTERGNVAEIISQPVRNGRRAMRFAALETRCELSHNWATELYQDAWYGYSIHIEEWGHWCYISQIHTRPDTDCPECKKNEGTAGAGRDAHRDPTPGLAYNGDSFNARIIYSYDHCNCTEQDSSLIQWYTDSWEAPRNTWLDFIIHVRYDYRKENNNGRIQIWYKESSEKEYDKVVDYSGPSCPDDDRLPNMRFGVHRKGSGDADNIVVYDNIRVYSGGGDNRGGTGWKAVNPDRKPVVSPGFHSENVPLYGAYEGIVTNGKTYKNKFDYTEIELQAKFTSPSGKVIEDVYGFYDGDGLGGQEGSVWRLRFMPTETGKWTYRYTWTDGTPGGAGSFYCVSSDYRGPLQIDPANPYYFRTMDGQEFHAKPYDLHQVGPMGSIWGPSKQPGPQYKGTDWSEDMDDVHYAIMDDYMVPYGYNLTMLGSANHEDYPPSYWVDDDPYRFNIPVWKVTENVYLHARERGIYCFQFDALVRIPPVKTESTLDRWNKQLVRYYCARLSSISSHTGFNPTRENYKLPRQGYSKEKMDSLMRFCERSIPENYKALLTIHDHMYKEFADWQDFAIRQHPSKHLEGNSKESQQGNNNFRGVDIDDEYSPYLFPVIGAEDVWEGLTQKGIAECIRPLWGQIMAGIIPLYSEWNRWIEVQGTGIAEEPYRKGMEWWFEKVDYRNPGWKKMNELVSSDNPYEVGCGIPNKEYVAYREGNGSLSIDLSNASGSYSVSFFNPFTADRYDDAATVKAGAIRTFAPPYKEDDVIVLLQKK